MSYTDIYDDSIISKKRSGSSDDPYKSISITLSVINGKTVLPEIPNRFEKLRVTGASVTMYEVEDGTLANNHYKVDYTEGVVFFNSTHNNKSYTFSFLGEGRHFFPANAIWVDNDTTGLQTAKDKFGSLDTSIVEQKNRVDNLIVNTPQPSEVVDIRVDRNGITHTTAKARIDADQKKIEDTFLGKDGLTYTSLKDRFDKTDDKIVNTNSAISEEAIKRDGKRHITNTIKLLQEGSAVKIVCDGDSMTYGYVPTVGGQVAKPYPAALQDKLRTIYNNTNVTVVNSGSPGWQSDEGLANFDTDVMAQNPNLVIIMYGINDCRGHVTYGSIVPIEDYKNNLSQMVLKAKKNNIEVILLSPTPILDTNSNNNAKLLDYARAVKEVAEGFNVGFVDLQTEVAKVFFNKKEAPAKFIPDNVHFKDEKYPLIAEIILGKLMYHQNSKNVLKISSQEELHIPLVRSPYVHTDCTIVFENEGQFYKQNYIMREDGGNGTYLRFSFFNETPNMNLVLKTAKNTIGGKISVVWNGNIHKTVDCYANEAHVFEAEDVLLEDIPIGFHTIEFKSLNIVKGQTVAAVAQVYLTEFVFLPNVKDETFPYALLNTSTLPTMENFNRIVDGKSRLINPNVTGGVGSVFFSADKAELKSGKTLVVEIEGKFHARTGFTWFGNHANAADDTSNNSKLNLGYMFLMQNNGMFLFNMGTNNTTGTSIGSNATVPNFTIKNKIRVEHTSAGLITVFLNDVQVMSVTNTKAYTGWFGLYSFEQGTVDIDRYEYCYK